MLLFGNLLAELAEISHASNFSEMEKLENVQHAVDFMSEHDVPRHVQGQVLSWTRFFHEHNAHTLKKKALLLRLPLRPPFREGPAARAASRSNFRCV